MLTNRNLPERLGEYGLIKRANSHLNTVKTLLAESKPKYWFERAMVCKAQGDWIGADYCLGRFLGLNPKDWQGWLSLAYIRAQLDNQDGCVQALLTAEFNKYITEEVTFGSTLSGHEWLCINSLIEEFYNSKYSIKWGIQLNSDEFDTDEKLARLGIKKLVGLSEETISQVAQLNLAVLLAFHYTFETGSGNVYGHNKSDSLSCSAMHVCFQITKTFIKYLLTTAKEAWLPEYADKTLFFAVTAARLHLISYNTDTLKVNNWFVRLTWKSANDPLVRYYLGTAASGIALNSPAPQTGPINKPFALEQLSLALTLEPLLDSSETFFLTRASAHAANGRVGFDWGKALRLPSYLIDDWQSARPLSIDLKDFYKDAIVDYEKAAKLNESNLSTQVELALLYAWANNNFPKALEHFSNAIAIWDNGQQSESYRWIRGYYNSLITSGTLLLSQKEYSKAAANFAKAQSFLPNHPYSLCDTNGWGQIRFAKMVGRLLAHAQFMNGETANSLALYNEVLEDIPVNGSLMKSYYGETALALRGRAEVKKSLGDNEDAAVDIHAALWVEKVRALYEKGQYVESDKIMCLEHFRQLFKT